MSSLILLLCMLSDGPVDVGTGNMKKADAGWLKVYTHRTPSLRDDFDIPTLVYLPYEVYDPKGKKVRDVKNNDWVPTNVRLAPGRYLVKYKPIGGKRIEFRVTIVNGRTSAVDVRKLGK